MANRLQRLNGWRRLWLVATVALGLWFVGLWPLLEAGKAHDGNFDYRSAIKRDFENPKCRDYQNAPRERLIEPAYESGGGTCWHLYTNRRYAKSAASPYTLEVYDRDRDAWWREVYLYALAFGLGGTLVISAAVYFLGWLVGWIATGFRPTRP